MSLYGPTFHVTPVDLCIIFQCILHISCIMYCGNTIVSNCFKLFQNITVQIREIDYHSISHKSPREQNQSTERRIERKILDGKRVSC